MKRQWRIQRQVSPSLDGQRRWDRAYQLILQWSQSTQLNQHSAQEQTNDDQSSDLCQSINPQSNADPDN